MRIFPTPKIVPLIDKPPHRIAVLESILFKLNSNKGKTWEEPLNTDAQPKKSDGTK